MRKLTLISAGFIAAVTLGLFIQNTVSARQGDTHGYGYPKTGLDAVAMNAVAGTRTFTIANIEGFADIVFWFDFTHTNDGIISLTCTGGPSSTDNDYTLTVCSGASTPGECAALTSGILKSGIANLTASAKWDGMLGVRGAHSLSCVAAHSGAPAAGDILTIKYETFTQ